MRISSRITRHLQQGSIHAPGKDAIAILADAIGISKRAVTDSLKELCSRDEVVVTPSLAFANFIGLKESRVFVKTPEGRRQSLYATTADGHHIPGKLPDHLCSELVIRKMTREEYLDKFGVNPPEGVFADGTSQPAGEVIVTTTSAGDISLRKHSRERMQRLNEVLDYVRQHPSAHSQLLTVEVTQQIMDSFDYPQSTAKHRLYDLEHLRLIKFDQERRYQGRGLIVINNWDRSVDEIDMEYLIQDTPSRLSEDTELSERLAAVMATAKWFIKRSNSEPFGLTSALKAYYGLTSNQARMYVTYLTAGGVVTILKDHGRKGCVYQIGPNGNDLEAALEQARSYFRGRNAQDAEAPADAEAEASAQADATAKAPIDAPTDILPSTQPAAMETVRISRQTLQELRDLIASQKQRITMLEHEKQAAAAMLVMASRANADLNRHIAELNTRLDAEDLTDVSLDDLLG